MRIHVVQRGDTVFSIANRYGVSSQRIITDNGLSDLPNLVVGQALLILFPETVHTVRAGETLTSIARAYGTSVTVLRQNNPDVILNPTLTVGQQLTITFTDDKIRSLYTNGYAYPYINRPILRQTLPYLSSLTIFGYGFREDGSLIAINDLPLIEQAEQNNAAPIMLLSSITEDGNFSGDRASLLFRDTTLQNRVISNIIDVMQRKGYVGLDVDFEYVRAADALNFQRFLQNVTEQLNAQGYTVNVDLAPKTSADQVGLLYEAHDYAALGAIADTVLLMTYEWGYTYGPPLAVAPIDSVRRVVEYAVTEIPNNKIMLGIPNYGYDWALPYVRGVTVAENIGNQYALRIAAQRGAEIQFDETAQSPYFNYWQGSTKHVVWFEDIRSIVAKYELIQEFNLRGAGYWTIMRGFRQNWAYVGAMYNIRKT